MTVTPELIISILSFAATLVVGRILYKQIQVQKQIMEGYDNYFKMLDIKKAKELREYERELHLSVTKYEAFAKIDAFTEQIMKEYEELARFATGAVNSLPDELQRSFIDEMFPINKPNFRHIDDEKHKKDV